MPTNNITYNLNEIINTKSEFQDILRENGINPGTVFSEYPSQIRSIIGSGGGGGGSIDEETLNSYISAYLTTYNFVDQPSLSYNSYITEAAFNNGTGGFITDIQNSTSGGKHILLYNRGEAVTPSALASMGYITSSDVSAMGYITAAAIDNNLIPKENNAYTLGDSTYLYAATYTSDLWLNSKNRFSNRSNNQINLQLNDSWRYTFHVNNFGPAADNTRDLGESSVRWRSTYTANLYADNAYISNYNNLIWTGTSAQYAALPNYTTYQIYLIQEA